MTLPSYNLADPVKYSTQAFKKEPRALPYLPLLLARYTWGFLSDQAPTAVHCIEPSDIGLGKLLMYSGASKELLSELP